MSWAAVLLRDGQPVSDPVPCTDWDAATILGPLVAGWLGGPVSVVNAVIDQQVRDAAKATLFDD